MVCDVSIRRVEMTEQDAMAGELPRRVVELEFKRPTVRLPEVDLEPVRRVAKDVLLTGIGAVVLTGRAVARAIKAANSAGVETAEHPGPVTRALLSLVQSPPQERQAAQSFGVLPVADYDGLDASTIIGLLGGLSRDEIALLLAYERDHQAREAVMAAMTARLA